MKKTLQVILIFYVLASTSQILLAQVPAWTNIFYYFNRAFGTAVKTDANGDVYSLAHCFYSNNFNNASTVVTKFTTNGNILWRDTLFYNYFAMDFFPEANATSVVFSSKIYKLNAAGALVDSIILSTIPFVTPYSSQGASRIIFDNQKNIFECGSVVKQNTPDKHFYIAKFDSLGSYLWHNVYDSGWNLDDQASDITIDDAGNSYLCGYSHAGTTLNSADAIVIKYDSLGNQSWIYTYDDSLFYNDYFVGVIADHSGNVYAGGVEKEKYLATYFRDALLVKLDNQGQLIWKSNYIRPVNDEDFCQQLVLNSLGNPTLAGITCSPGNPWQLFVVQFDSFGTQLWHQEFQSTLSSSNCEFYKIVPDSLGNILTIGSCYDTNSFSNMITLVYDQSGNKIFEAWLNFPTSSEDRPSDVTEDASGNIFLTGSYHYFLTYEMAVAKYGNAITTSNNSLSGNSLLIYPNPTTGKLLITNSEPGIKELEIFNLIGEKVKSVPLHATSQEIRTMYDISELPSGIYILQAHSREKTWRTKVVKQ